ncbi:MAG: alpha/beta hydrolase, partial [Roseobacter sp.]
MLYHAAEIDAARCLAVLIPGAFSRISIFERAEAWRGRGYALVYYRLPGLDGRPLSPPLDLEAAAGEIVALARRYPDKPLRFLGYSTGGPIALIAAAQVSGDVKVALMSTAVERGGGLATAVRTVADLAVAVRDTRSVRLATVWFSYYRVLLFGRAVRHDASLADRAKAIIEARRNRIVLPTAGLRRAHTRALRRWRKPAGLRFPSDQVHLFWGREDCVFHQNQIQRFARQIGGAGVTAYPG